MVKQFRKIIKTIYQYYLQMILFIAGFLMLNIAAYKFNSLCGLIVTGCTLILFAVVLNKEQE